MKTFCGLDLFFDINKQQSKKIENLLRGTSNQGIAGMGIKSVTVSKARTITPIYDGSERAFTIMLDGELPLPYDSSDVMAANRAMAYCICDTLGINRGDYLGSEIYLKNCNTDTNSLINSVLNDNAIKSETVVAGTIDNQNFNNVQIALGQYK